MVGPSLRQLIHLDALQAAVLERYETTSHTKEASEYTYLFHVLNDPDVKIRVSLNQMVDKGNERRDVVDKRRRQQKSDYGLWNNVCEKFNDADFRSTVTPIETLAVHCNPKWMYYRTAADLKSMFGKIKAPFTMAKDDKYISGQNIDGT